MKINPDSLKDIVIKLFNAYSYEINSNSKDYPYSNNITFALKKDKKVVFIHINMNNNFLKIKGNECLDLEKNPKKKYFINYEDIEYLSRINRLNIILNEL